MKFVSSRELRINPGVVWKRLRQEKDLVITANGKPVGVLTFAEEDNLKDVLATLRQGRAQAAVAHLRQAAVAHGLDTLSNEAIADIIGQTRRGGRKAKGAGKR
jgi:prevent-host-death family protein